jgi:hypothetical protein
LVKAKVDKSLGTELRKANAPKRPPFTGAPPSDGSRWFADVAAVVGEMARGVETGKATREQVRGWGAKLRAIASEMIIKGGGE